MNTRQKWLLANLPNPKTVAHDQEALEAIEDAELDAAFPKNSMGRRAREKGKRFERAITKAMQAIYPGAKRGYWQSRLAQSGAAEACDVEGTPWWVECKDRQHVSIPNTYRQCIESKDHRPILMVLRWGILAKTFAVMGFDDLLSIIARAESGNVMPLNLLAEYMERAYRCKNGEELGRVIEEARTHYLTHEPLNESEL